MIDPVGQTYEYKYSARGDPDTLLFPNSGLRARGYDDDGNLTSEFVSDTFATRRSVILTHDARGKLLKSYNAADILDTLNLAYSGMGAIDTAKTSWHGTDSANVNNGIYTSDAFGNRLTQVYRWRMGRTLDDRRI